jgi:hypothetical protein
MQRLKKDGRFAVTSGKYTEMLERKLLAKDAEENEKEDAERET